MKIDYLEIRSNFKNLNNVKINFDENNLMTVIVGRNGSGKSNILEALAEIFKNLDLGKAASFSYSIKYKLGNDCSTKWITIDADPNRGTIAKQYNISSEMNGSLKRIPFSKVKRDRNGRSDYLPKHIFAYYSGPSGRLEKYFIEHRTRFYKDLLFNNIDLDGDIRPLFYAKPYHSQFVLLAFFLSNTGEKERLFLNKHIGIESLDSIHFVFRKPQWAKRKNELYWGASGVVREFLDKLIPFALAPLKITRQENVSLTGNSINNEFLHIFLPNEEALRSFANDLSPDIFFKMLESTLLSEIISEVRIRVKIKSIEQPITFNELSEGEQQLLTVIGLLKFTGGSDSLFLLDEPDTHLNPSWATKYLKLLKDFIPNQETSHLLMVTHHPLTISELEKEQIQVMKRVDKQISSKQPLEDPRGMGVSQILRSDIFGLKTTLDNYTNDKVLRRNLLASKDDITDKELEELSNLSDELDSLGFTFSSEDTDYNDFLKLRYHTEIVK